MDNDLKSYCIRAVSDQTRTALIFFSCLVRESAPSAVAQTFILCVLVNFHSIFFFVSFVCFLIVLNLGCKCGEGCLFYSGWVSGTKTL